MLAIIIIAVVVAVIVTEYLFVRHWFEEHLAVIMDLGFSRFPSWLKWLLQVLTGFLIVPLFICFYLQQVLFVKHWLILFTEMFNPDLSHLA